MADHCQIIQLLAEQGCVVVLAILQNVLNERMFCIQDQGFLSAEHGRIHAGHAIHLHHILHPAALLGKRYHGGYIFVFQVLNFDGQAIESGKALPKLEILFTVGEEAGLYGAKAFDVSLLTSKTMYVLDSPGRIGRIVNGAPGRALLEAQVFGKAAHAGNEPEKGIDAAKIMAEMLATMETGRLDENTTSNFSHLWSKTCEAMNVVCDHAILRGEMRSRSGEKLDRYEAYFQSHCREIAEKRGARVEFKRENTFLPFVIPEDSEMIQIVTESLKEMGIEPQINGGGGGMDGNIFNQKGITCVGIATGYFKNHSTEEYLHLDDFYHAGELVARIIGRIA